MYMAQCIVVIFINVGGSDGVCSQGRLNSLLITFMKHATFVRALIRLFSINSLNVYVHGLLSYEKNGK